MSSPSSSSSSSSSVITVSTHTVNLVDKSLACYGDPYAVYREMLQNADDAHAEIFTIGLVSDDDKMAIHDCNDLDGLRVKGMIISNDGADWSVTDLSRLQVIAMGNDDSNSVGQFGVGFYSVFALSSNPSVASGNNRREFIIKEDQILILPSIGEPKIQGTEIKLPFKETKTISYKNNRNEKKKQKIIYESKADDDSGYSDSHVLNLVELQQFLIRALCFTRYIQKIQIQYQNRSLITICRSQSQYAGKIALTAQLSSPRDYFQVKTVDGLTDALYKLSVEAATNDDDNSYAASDNEGEKNQLVYRVVSANIVLSDSKGNQLLQKMQQEMKKKPPSSFSVSFIMPNTDKITRLESYRASPFFARVFALLSQQQTSTVLVAPANHTNNGSSSRKRPSNSDIDSDGDSKNNDSADDSSGWFAIGQPTRERTGIGAHINSVFYPSMERHSIDMDASHAVGVWNRDLLHIIGQIAYQHFSHLCSSKQADLAYLIYGWPPSPDSKVQYQMNEGFFSSSMMSSFPIPISNKHSAFTQIVQASTRSPVYYIDPDSALGRLQEQEVLARLFLAHPRLVTHHSAFVRWLLNNGRWMVKIERKHIEISLEDRILTLDQLTSLLTWLCNAEKCGGDTKAFYRHNTERERLLKQKGIKFLRSAEMDEIVELSSINFFQANGAALSFLPLPPNVLDIEVSSKLTEERLTEYFGLKPISFSDWLKWIVSTKGSSRIHELFPNRDTSIKSWKWLSQGFNTSVANLRDWDKLKTPISSMKSIPTIDGEMKMIKDCNFPSALLSPDHKSIIDLPLDAVDQPEALLLSLLNDNNRSLVSRLLLLRLGLPPVPSTSLIEKNTIHGNPLIHHNDCILSGLACQPGGRQSQIVKAAARDLKLAGWIWADAKHNRTEKLRLYKPEELHLAQVATELNFDSLLIIYNPPSSQMQDNDEDSSNSKMTDINEEQKASASDDSDKAISSLACYSYILDLLKVRKHPKWSELSQLIRNDCSSLYSDHKMNDDNDDVADPAPPLSLQYFFRHMDAYNDDDTTVSNTPFLPSVVGGDRLVTCREPINIYDNNPCLLPILLRSLSRWLKVVCPSAINRYGLNKKPDIQSAFNQVLLHKEQLLNSTSKARHIFEYLDILGFDHESHSGRTRTSIHSTRDSGSGRGSHRRRRVLNSSVDPYFIPIQIGSSQIGWKKADEVIMFREQQNRTTTSSTITDEKEQKYDEHNGSEDDSDMSQLHHVGLIYIDFGPEANNFLSSRCGVPDRIPVARLFDQILIMAKQDREALKHDKEQRTKYLSLVILLMKESSSFSEMSSLIRRSKNINDPWILACRYSEDRVEEYDLVCPGNIYINDNILFAQQFQCWLNIEKESDSDKVMDFYKRLGAAKSLHKEVGVTHHIPNAADIKGEDHSTAKHILSRWFLLTQDISGHPLTGINESYRQLASLRCYSVVQITSTWTLEDTTRQGIPSTAICHVAHNDQEVIIYLLHPAFHWLDIASELSRLLFPKSNKSEDATYRINTLLSADLRCLAAKGYPVEKLLREQQETGTKSKQSAGPTMSCRYFPDYLNRLKILNEALKTLRPFDKSKLDPMVNHSSNSSNRSGSSNSSHNHQSTQQESNYMNHEILRQMRPWQKQQRQGQPQAQGERELLVLLEEGFGADWLSKIPQYEQHIQQLSQLLLNLAVKVLEISESVAQHSLILFVHRPNTVIAFNYAGSVFFNLRYFIEVHAGHINASIYCDWYLTFIHQLSHQRCPSHDLPFESHMQSMAAAKFDRFRVLLTCLECQAKLKQGGEISETN